MQSAALTPKPQFDPAGLPALIDRACQRLADARSSAEVLEAKALGEAALHYAKVTQAANETHADCLRMIVRAEVRMVDEIDQKPSAQGRRTDIVSKENEVPTIDELGVTRKQVHEWRKTRDAGADVVEGAIAKAISEGRAPTKADVTRAVDGKPHVSHNSGENEWYTPEPYVKAARQVLGTIDLDPASSEAANKVVRAKQFYSIDDNGLAREWKGSVWMNPPYAQPLVAQFCSKLVDSMNGKTVPAAVVLVNNATETGWFRELADLASGVCFPTGRVKFWSPDKESTAPLQGQALLYLGPKVATFTVAFSHIGVVWVKP